MTRRNNGIGLAIFATLAITACGPADVTVFVALGDEANPEPLDAVEVRLLPYDRDQIFDSLASEAGTPEPQIPPDLMAARDEIALAQQAWRDSETRWGVLRDTLQKLNDAMEGLNRAESLYRQLFMDYEDFEGQYNAADREMGRLFDEFDALQQAAIGRMDSMRAVQGDWADQAFEDYDLVVFMKTEASGLEALADTTEANGIADFQDGVAPGTYWVHARHRLPYDELYWNVQVAITREESFVLRLSAENADRRPIF